MTNSVTHERRRWLVDTASTVNTDPFETCQTKIVEQNFGTSIPSPQKQRNLNHATFLRAHGPHLHSFSVLTCHEKGERTRKGFTLLVRCCTINFQV